LSTSIFLTDALGSILATFSNTAGSAALLGNQVYGPYGTQRYNKGAMGTNKGFTGQYNDSLTGLDYYNARYYDPTAAVFLSADTVQGNISGMNPYDYVGGNPETWSDPTGQRVACPDPSGCGGSSGGGSNGGGGEGNGGGRGTGSPSLGDVGTLIQETEQAAKQVLDPTTDPLLPIAVATAPVWVPVLLEIVIVLGIGILAGVILGVIVTVLDTTQGAKGEIFIETPETRNKTAGGAGGAPVADQGASPFIPIVGDDRVRHVGPGPSSCSFTPDTRVTTNHGEQPISTLQVGEKVQSYNPKTHKMEMQPILHVWTHKDNDLVDLTITATTTSQHGKPVTIKNEVVHTTSEHPFLTIEKGFVPAGKIQMGMHILKADESVGVITGWRSVHGTKVMYNLEVARDHTFTVGVGQWVVHNECDSKILRGNMINAGVTFHSGQDAHHVIPCKEKNHALIQAAGGKFDMNDPVNGRAMWGSGYSAQALLAGEPWHANSPGYSNLARTLMDEAYQGLVNSGTLSPDTAYNALLEVIDNLNGAIDARGQLGVMLGAACSLPGID
jgi:RHS repeat-associated protein